jgi:hypothetical protein
MAAPRQLSFEFGPVAVPAKPLAPALTIADCRRMLHTAQVFQLNAPRYRPRAPRAGGVDAGDDQGAAMKNHNPRQLE